jgi:hypothetical protein
MRGSYRTPEPLDGGKRYGPDSVAGKTVMRAR